MLFSEPFSVVLQWEQVGWMDDGGGGIYHALSVFRVV